MYACLELRPADRPLPHEVAEALEPVLDRLPPVSARGADQDPLPPQVSLGPPYGARMAVSSSWSHTNGQPSARDPTAM